MSEKLTTEDRTSLMKMVRKSLHMTQDEFGKAMGYNRMKVANIDEGRSSWSENDILVSVHRLTEFIQKRHQSYINCLNKIQELRESPAKLRLSEFLNNK